METNKPDVFERKLDSYRNTYYRQLSQAGKHFDIQNFGTHNLRRSYITSLDAQNIKITTISRLVGHSSVKTTEQYININENEIEKAQVGYQTQKQK